eukprot:6212621-Pleurochrysis_carterae.AAC.8
MASRRWPRRLRRKVFRLGGSNTTGCSLSLAATGGNFEKTRAPVDGAVGKDAEVRNIGVVGLPGHVGVKVKAVVASDALCKLVV